MVNNTCHAARFGEFCERLPYFAARILGLLRGKITIILPKG
jgi:hypothetical protein